jgi:hypothetical protein
MSDLAKAKRDAEHWEVLFKQEAGRNDTLVDRLTIALSFAEHPEFMSIQVNGAMVPRDVWIDETTRLLDRGDL